VRFNFISCLSSEEESLHTLSERQPQILYCVIITPVEQSLQPVDYAWWQKQPALFTRVYVCLGLLYATNICILCSVLNRYWGFATKL